MATTSFPEDPDDESLRTNDEPIGLDPDDKESLRVDDELIGLDPDDPETRAFAAHLERQHNVRPSFTVEGYLSDVRDFADSANRLGGHRKLMASILVLLILLGVTITAWDAFVYVVTTFIR